MKILILGGSGFVSSWLAKKAMAAGHEVWTLTRGSRPTVPGVHVLTADRADGDALRTVLESTATTWDAVMDCICFSPDHAAVDLSVLPAFTSRLVVISTDSVYDPYHKTVPQTEESEWYMQDGGYGCMKRKMEEAFLAAETSLRWTILRPGHIFGAGSEIGCFPEHSRQKDLIPHMLADKPVRLIDGGQLLIHPIYVEDLVETMLSCVDKPGCENEIFCIGGPDIIPNAKYYEVIGEIIGHPAKIESVELEGGLAAHPEFSGHLCQRAYDLTKLRSTGVKMPDTPLAVGLRKHIEWIMQRDNL